jgi:hypothetical protein
VGEAKRLIVKPITGHDARTLVRALHYSRKIVNTSRLHLGVFLDDRCGGVMQFWPSMDHRRTSALVRDTPWNNFLELNRLAFADWLPRNSESRALGYALRWIRRTYPHVQWIISFADATQCGDGTIYRASGFLLTGIKKNQQILRLPNGAIIAKKTLDDPNHTGPQGQFGSAHARANGAVALPGFQLRYVYFLDPTARERLTVPVLPFSEIAARGAGMYRGVRARSAENGTAAPTAGDGVIPIRALHS